jgi:hypothetical protein
MQHLLDFIHEHTLEEQLYFVAATPVGELELMWRRGLGENLWEVRPNKCEGPWQPVHCGDLLEHLEERGVDMQAVERELQAMVVTQLAFADVVLRDATQLLGRDVVQRAVHRHRDFMTELQGAIQRLASPGRASMIVVPGGGDQTSAREGHLTVVR